MITQKIVNGMRIKSRAFTLTECNTAIGRSAELGDGHRIKCRSMCEGVRMWIQDVHIRQKFYLFRLGAANVVLGLDWLAEEREINTNFDDLTIRVKIGGQTRLLQAEPQVTKFATSMKSITPY